VISRGARSAKVKIVACGSLATGRIAVRDGHEALALLIIRSRTVSGFDGAM